MSPATIERALAYWTAHTRREHDSPGAFVERRLGAHQTAGPPITRELISTTRPWSAAPLSVWRGRGLRVRTLLPPQSLTSAGVFSTRVRGTSVTHTPEAWIS